MSSDEKKHLDQIAMHLDKLKIPFVLETIGNTDEDQFPALVCVYRHGNIDYDVIIYSLNEWIHAKAFIVEVSEYSPEQLLKIFEICLSLNYERPEVTFSLHNKRIYIEMDCLSTIGYEDFEGEFKSIAKGIDSFVEVMAKESSIKIESEKTKRKSSIRRKKELL